MYISISCIHVIVPLGRNMKRITVLTTTSAHVVAVKDCPRAIRIVLMKRLVMSGMEKLDWIQ